MGVSDLTFAFASLLHQQFDDAQEAFGRGQVKRTVTYLATHILIRPKLQQQLSNLSNREKGSAKARSQQGKKMEANGVYLLMAVTGGDMQRGEKHSILNVHVSAVLQEDVCCLVTTIETQRNSTDPEQFSNNNPNNNNKKRLPPRDDQPVWPHAGR